MHPSNTNNEVVGTIVKVAGPLIVASGMANVQMYDVVRVSEKKLIGEVIELRNDLASIQVYEETAGLGPGEPVYSTGEALSVELAPGLIERMRSLTASASERWSAWATITSAGRLSSFAAA